MFDQRTSGVLLHISSLPGPCGGDLGPCARHFVDWLVVARQSVWQMLPIAPVGVSGSPYMGLSSCAGNPAFVAFEPLVANGWIDAAAMPKLPPGGRLDVARAAELRCSALRTAFAGFEAAASSSHRDAFGAWCLEESDWLDDYADFMVRVDHFGHDEWWRWSVYPSPDVGHVRGTTFWKFVQWCFDWQMRELREYANRKGVRLLGDLPLYVAHYSVDVWAESELFAVDDEGQLELVTGVPPDPVSPSGQRWGTPQFRWERHAEQGYRWWIRRLRRSHRFFDAMRIDHFRAFAAYWEIPAAADAAGGRWVKGPGRAFFDKMYAALGPVDWMVEDLAYIITADVHALREELRLPGTRVLLYGFVGGPDSEYLPHNYTRHCVAYTGTHDNDTARGAWCSSSTGERAAMKAYLGDAGEAVHWAMIRVLATSVANTVIFPFQDVLGLDSSHRMNVAGTVSHANWSWRFEWSMVGPEPALRLGEITTVSGRYRPEPTDGAVATSLASRTSEDPWDDYPF